MLDQRFMAGSGREVWTGMCIERRSGDGTATALPAGANVVSAQRLEAGWGTPAQLAEFVRLARERGPVRWDPAVPEALAARTGLTRAEATLLWATFPEMSEWGQQSDFLGSDLRKTLGLTRSEAKAARRALPQDIEHRCRLLHAAMPDDPATLWAPLGDGPDDASPVARLAAAWARLFGRRSPYSQDALVEAAGLGRPTPPGMLLAPLLDQAASRPLTRDRDCWITQDQHDRLVLATKEGDGDKLSGMVADLAATIPWAFACRPVGDPLRARLPELLTLVRDRLSHPGLLLAVSPWHDPYNPGEELRRLFGQTPYRTRNGPVLDGSADDGLTVAVARHHSLALFFRPALLGGDARSAVLRAHGDPGWGPTPTTVTAVELLRSAGYAAMAERVRTTPVPDGGFEANPAHAAPALVQEVQATLTLSSDAAVLYLQLLALAEPTDRNLRRWNRWTPQRQRGAAAELLSAGLVLQAKREGARRSLFLPGEWLPLRKADRAMPEEWKASRLPLEAWKAPLYRLERDRRSGQPRGPLPRFLPLVPLHELFAMAWAHVQAGDRPGGEQA